MSSRPAPVILADGGVSPPDVNKLVPDFALEDRSGKAHTLSSFRGNLIFLNFWATWCPPCRKEFPLMEALNQRLKARGFSMIAISVDDSWEAIDEFLATQRFKPTFLILRDPDKKLTTKIYGTTQFPETYFVDNEGKLVQEKIKGDRDWISPTWISKFESILNSFQKNRKN